MSDKTCQERVRDELESRLEDLRLLWAGYTNAECPKCDGLGEIDKEDNPEESDACEFCDGSGKLEEDIKDLGSLNEYGLSFDYVAPGTFKGQKEPYFRYQLSWGGPSDEFRFYASKTRYTWESYRIEYWFLDWFDGAHVILSGDDFDLIENIFTGFFDASTDSVYEEAMKDYEPEYDDEDEETEEDED